MNFCDEKHLPVVFVLTLQNSKGFNGIRITSEFGMFDKEQEVILEEHFEAYLMDIGHLNWSAPPNQLVMINLFNDN